MEDRQDQKGNSALSAAKKENELNIQGDLHLKPVIFCLGIAGCYSFQQQKNTLTECLMFLYKMLAMSTVLFWCIKTFLTPTENLQPITTYIIVTLITLECVCNYFICWKTFSKRTGNFQPFMNKVNMLLAELYENNIILNKNYINRRQIVCVIFAMFLILSDVILQISFAFIIIPNPGELENVARNETFAYTYPLKDSYFSRAIITLMGFFIGLSLVIPPLFLTIINTMLLATFNALNSRMEKCLERSEEILDYVEKLRRFHLKTCATISRIDKDLSHLYGSIVFWTLCQAILVLYTLVRSGQSFMEILVLLYMMGLSLVVLIEMSISAALVHEAVSHIFVSFVCIRV